MTTRGNYKGNPTITLGSEGKYPFTFGLSKAKLILENVEAIRRFVEENGGGRAGDGGGRMSDPGEMAADRWNESQGGGR